MHPHMLAEIATFAAYVVPAGALYWFWGRPLSRRLLELEAKLHRALPAALDELDEALDEKIALMEGDAAEAGDDADTAKALRQARAVTRGGTKIPRMDPGIDLALIDRRGALALAKQEMLLSRNRESLPPKTAALKWPPGTIFKDRYDVIFVVMASGVPQCIYQDSRVVDRPAKQSLANFDGGRVDLLVTPDELRAGALLS